MFSSPESISTTADQRLTLETSDSDFSLEVPIAANRNGSENPIAVNLPVNCRYPDCASISLSIRLGKPPHAAEIVCQDCDRHQKWLSKSIAAQLGFGGEAE